MGKSLKGKELGIGITQRRDGRYSAKFKSKSGKRIEKYFDKPAAARSWLAEAKYEDAHGQIGSSAKITVDAWFSYWITEIKEKTVRWSTLRSYRDRYEKNVRGIIGSMLIGEVRPMHCQNILNVMDNQGYAGASMERTRVTLSAMFADALENGIISANPVSKSVKCPKQKNKNAKVLTLEKQERFLTAAKESIHYSHYLFVLQTGIRSSELRGLKWSDLDFQNRMIHIRRNVTHDSNRNRFVTGELKTSAGQRDIPMTQTAYDLLMEIKCRPASYKQEHVFPEFTEHVFLNRNGRLIPNSNYDQSLNKICTKAGIERISMHTLRHTFATRCIESGMKPKTLQKILGHANIAMTMDLYVHVTEDELEKEMQKFENLYRME